MTSFKPVKPESIQQNAFEMIGKDWMLVTAEADGKCNSMTASWGGLGVLWNKNVAYVFIRPQRHTKQFVDQADTFSLTFFTEDHRKALNYMGSVTGKDEDKIKGAGLTLKHIDGTPYFDEARLVIRCKKLFVQDLKPESFIDTTLIEKVYSEKDFHTMYVAEITDVLVRE